MRIAVFDYRIVANNPIGSCHLRLLRELSREHEFTVFAVEFENPDPDRIQFVRIPAPRRPLAALFAGYHALAPLAYAAYRLQGGTRFDLLQIIESNLSFGDLSYAHFCHRGYLQNHWSRSRPDGIRRPLRWLDHWLHAAVEPWIFRRVNTIVVPSRGLARELANSYPYAALKIHVVPNAVDVQRLSRPADFDREGFRARFGVSRDDVVLVFVALGHFERKGLPKVLDAMRDVRNGGLKLLVVGGAPDLINDYRRRAAKRGLEHSVLFAGPQTDVRPFLWSSDAFVFPSAYEAASLAFYEAAAAGLPLLSCPLNGTEVVLCDNETGFTMMPEAESVAEAIRRFLACSEAERRRMGSSACRAAQAFDVLGWADRWRALYANLPPAATKPSGAPAESRRGLHVV